MSRSQQQPLSIETTLRKPDLILELSEYDTVLCKTLAKSNSGERTKFNDYCFSTCSSHSLGRAHSLVKFQQLDNKLILQPETSPLRYDLMDLVSVFNGVNKLSDCFLSIRGARPDANIVLIDGIRAIEYENAFIPFEEDQSVKVKYINN